MIKRAADFDTGWQGGAYYGCLGAGPCKLPLQVWRQLLSCHLDQSWCHQAALPQEAQRFLCCVLLSGLLVSALSRKTLFWQTLRSADPRTGQCAQEQRFSRRVAHGCDGERGIPGMQLIELM